MRIQHNIMAMSAYRNYTNNVSAMKKNLEKLSSGYKINRAGDDAAGLAISEKMRAQITGLETAQKNAKDGISLVQTAEGALTEVHDMLNRMVELATQSANGTYDDTTDRYQLQKEMDQLRSEINRIADSANFNGIKLLDGSMDGAAKMGDAQAVQVAAVLDGDQSVKEAQAGVYTLDLNRLNITADAGKTVVTISDLKVGSVAITGSITVAVTDGKVTGQDIAAALKTAIGSATMLDNQIGGISYGVEVNEAAGTVKLTALEAPTAAGSIVQMTATVTVTDGTSNQGDDQAVHVDTHPVIGGTQKLAQGKFTLTTDMVKDGNQLTIGDSTYTFKVGSESTVSGANVIDLSKYTESDADLIKAAASALSELSKSDANALFDITADTTTGTVYLGEKTGKVDYTKDWDLQGSSTAGDGDWNKAVANSKRKTGVVTWAAAGTADDSKGLTLQIGDTADSYNQLKVNIGDTHCAALGIDSIKISDQASAATAIDAIKDAINQVSDIRGTLGATQNRLDHTINNLSVMTENIQDAESTIRDTDVAEEMMAYTKNNILIQSAQAMLAQANQVPQGVLQLLG